MWVAELGSAASRRLVHVFAGIEFIAVTVFKLICLPGLLSNMKCVLTVSSVVLLHDLNYAILHDLKCAFVLYVYSQ